MSDDEVMASIGSVITTVCIWSWWYATILWPRNVNRLRSGASVVGLLLTPPAMLLSLLVVLRVYASRDVQFDPRYLFMYTAMGMAWMGVATLLTPLWGVSLRWDVIANRNASAVWSIVGWMIGVMLAFTGANIGDGPHWFVVVYCGAISTITLAIIVVLFQKYTGANDAVTIERDVATGIRLVGMLVSCGMILGIAVAGDWESASATLVDFTGRSWPAWIILIVAVVMQLLLAPSREMPRPSRFVYGVMPAFAMLAVAAAWAAWVGDYLIRTQR